MLDLVKIQYFCSANFMNFTLGCWFSQEKHLNVLWFTKWETFEPWTTMAKFSGLDVPPGPLAVLEVKQGETLMGH